MNIDESKAKEYLKYKGFSKIEFEPDGNIPPDFLVNDKIAIEVRRLNEYINLSNSQTNLEDAQQAIERICKEVCDSLKAENFTNSSYLIIQFQRPLDFRSVKKQLTRHLQSLIANNKTGQPNRLVVDKNLTIRTLPKQDNTDKPFILASCIDFDQGGGIVDLLYRNLDFAIKEKAKKIAPYQANYSEWWLILVDYVSYITDEFDVNQLLELPAIPSSFDKIIIISSEHPTHGIILY